MVAEVMLSPVDGVGLDVVTFRLVVMLVVAFEMADVGVTEVGVFDINRVVVTRMKEDEDEEDAEEEVENVGGLDVVEVVAPRVGAASTRK